MKNLIKLKLKEYHEMDELEMKYVLGMQYNPNYKPACGSENDSSCGGVCAPKYENGQLISKTCKKPSGDPPPGGWNAGNSWGCWCG